MKCPHCDIPIDEHEAGRETDVCVAVAVMGWEFVPKETVADLLTLHRSSSHEGKTTEDLVKVPNGETYFPAARVPKHSSDIAAAWEVVGRMAETQIPGHVGPTFLHSLRRCSPGRRWGVTWCTDFGYTNEVTADTAPLAICRAALKATLA